VQLLYADYALRLAIGIQPDIHRAGVGHSCFTDQERDAETGLDYFGARYYDPWVGRFMSVDPESLGGSMFPAAGHPRGLLITSLLRRVAKTRLILPIRYQVRGVFSNKNSTGISVRIRIFGPAPALVHEGYGGIALPFKFVVGRGITALEGREIFNDRKRIARGIAVAFDPYVPRQLH